MGVVLRVGMNQYLKYVLEQTPRVLSQIDRDSDSPTYGCCDRKFWHYKVRDFPCAIMQQSGLGLGLLYLNDFKGNIYYGKEEIKQIAIATVYYWLKIQHRDGSFDEHWPYEHGLPPTIFTLYTVCELVKLFSLEDPKILRGIAKTARHLVNNVEKKALNQEIASLTAVFNASLVLKSGKLKKEAYKKFLRLLKLQDTEGWFAEYGGADIGYLSVSLNYMAEFYKLSGDKRSLDSCFKILDFLQYFVHPDGSFGGDYGSRNTEYFLPYGFEVVGNEMSLTMIDKMMGYLFENKSMDDRYLCHYVYPSFVMAGLNFRNKRGNLKLPCFSKIRKYFPNAGLFVYGDSGKYLVSSLKKGGVIVAFDGSKRILNDCGYRAKVGKKLLVTNWLDEDFNVVIDESKARVESSFYKVKFHVPSPFQHFLLRLSSFFVGSSLIPLMKRLLILPNAKSSVRFSRTLYLDKEIKIKDIINSDVKMKWLKSTDGLSLRFCPSSRFYQTSTLSRSGYRLLDRNVKKVVVEKSL